MQDRINSLADPSGHLRPYQRESSDNRQSTFIVGLAGWSFLDVFLFTILDEDRECLQKQGVVVEVFDIDDHSLEYDKLFAPLYDSRRAINPIIGYWQNGELQWVDYSFVGSQRMLTSIGIPMERLLTLYPKNPTFSC